MRYAKSALSAAVLVGCLAGTTQAATLSNPVANGTITIDASRDDWAGLDRYPDDGREGHAIDIGFVTLAHDADNLYIRYQMYDPSPAFSGNWKLLLDTDQNAATGYHGNAYVGALGAERMIEGATVWSFADGFGQGDFSGWTNNKFEGFNEAGGVANDIEVVVPLAWLANENQVVEAVNFVLWVNSDDDWDLDDESSDDHLPNGAHGGTSLNVHTYVLVPEPAALGMIGVAGLMLRRRRIGVR